MVDDRPSINKPSQIQQEQENMEKVCEIENSNGSVQRLGFFN
jgi:hypothetical protein